MQGEQPNFLLLGPVAVVGEDGATAELGGAQRRAVLAQLVVSVGRVVSTDALGSGIWGEHPPPTAQKSLQVHVSRLRRVLPPGTLATRPPGYALEVCPESTDVVRFEQAVERARAQRAAGQPTAAADLLRSALDLWRGAALADVADFPFAAGPVARLEQARMQAVEERIEADLAVGRHAAVVGELEALVRDDPLRERLWAHLMVALYRCDRQADALDAYSRARGHLVEELGLEPGPELRRLEQHILDQTLPLGPGPDEPAVARAPVTARATTRAPTPVVGRDPQLAALTDALDAATGGSATAVAVRGDEGLGKTTLISAFTAGQEGRARVAAGRCREHLRVPFGPWSEILRQVGADDELELLEGSTGFDGEAPERRRARLFDGVTGRLRDAARDQPLIVVLDDLHWSDDASITLLLHILGELSSSPVLVLTAWRDREIGVGHPVTRLAHHLARADAASLDLGPLARGDIADLLTLTDGDLDAIGARRVASRIHDVTGGVPLFVAEAVATLQATGGDVPASDDADLDLPEIVRTLVGRRLALAGPAAVTVADACAVLADPFAPGVVGSLVPELPVDETLGGLDALVGVGLLEDHDEGCAFAHAAFRNAVDASMRAGRRQMLNAAAYRALARGATQPAVLAHHSEHAGPLVSDAEVVRQLRHAGTDAVARGAFLDAAAFFTRAADRATGADRDEVLVTLADALWRAGDITAAKAVASEVVSHGVEGGVADGVLTDAVVLHGTFGAGYGLDLSSIAAADGALSVVVDAEQRARLRVARAYHHAMWGSPVSVALAAVAEARAELPDPCTPGVAGELMFAESLALLGTADLPRRQHLADELVALGRCNGVARDIGRGLRMRSLTEMSDARLDRLGHTLDELFGVAEATGSWLYRSDAWRWSIARSLATGETVRAATDLDELERVSASPLAGRAFVGTQRLLLHLSRGELEPCLALLDGLRSVLPDDPTQAPDRRLADLFRLVVLIEMDRTDEAADEFDRLRSHLDLDVAACRRYPAELALTAQLVAELGTSELAPALIERLRPFGGQLIVLSWGEGILGAADRYLAGLTSLTSGRLDDATYARALDLERGSGATVEVARTLVARRRAEQRLRATAPR